MKKNITRCAALPAQVQVVKMGVRDGALYMDTDEAYRLEDGSKAGDTSFGDGFIDDRSFL